MKIKMIVQVREEGAGLVREAISAAECLELCLSGCALPDDDEARAIITAELQARALLLLPEPEPVEETPAAPKKK
jgi:hypothetical protein